LFCAPYLPLDFNLADLHLGVGLPMADSFLVLLLALELKDDDFVPTAVGHDGGLHLAAGYQFAAFLERSLNGQFDFSADLSVQFFHADNISRGNPVLFSARFNDCVHKTSIESQTHTSIACQ